MKEDTSCMDRIKMVMKGLCFIVLAGTLGKCLPGNSSTLRIAVASNMAEPIRDIIEKYQSESDLNIDIIIGSSGKLTAQIQHGAPYDIFISADMDYLDSLYSENLLEGAPVSFVKGELILWTIDKSPEPGLDYLLQPEVRKIAMPNPTTAPYGRAALEALTNLGHWDLLKEKAVFGESVTQTNQFILTRAVQAGITSLSLTKSPQFHESGQWISINNQLFEPILHGIGIINSTGNPEECRKLIHFLKDEYSESVLIKYGYQLES